MNSPDFCVAAGCLRTCSGQAWVAADMLPVPADIAVARLGRLMSSGKFVADARNSLTKPRVDVLAAQGAPINAVFAAMPLHHQLAGSWIVYVEATQAGDSQTSAAPAVMQTFSVTSARGGRNDGDVPFPPWALVLLGDGLLAAMRKRLG